MKRLFSGALFALLATTVLFSSCKDENDDGNISETTYEFSVKSEYISINAPADGEQYTILVTSTKTANAGTSNVAYQVVSMPSWAKAGIQQTALLIVVEKNSATTAREEGKIVLRQEESKKELEITVNQPGFAYSMSLNKDGYTTARCKVLNIEPEITGFDQNPKYKWTVKDSKGTTDAGTDKTLSFLKLETGAYEVSLTIKDDSGIEQTATTTVTVKEEETAYSPYISEVVEYMPAVCVARGVDIPFNNTDTKTSALAKVNTQLKGKDFLSTEKGVTLGSLGGYIVFKFDHTVINVEGKRDFRIGSYASASAYPAPGIVYVAFDKNGNGKADDDEWYEIAGSEYKNSSTRQVNIVYTRPETILTSPNGKDYINYTLNGEESGAFNSGGMANVLPIWPYWLQDTDEGKTMTFNKVRMLASNTPMNGMWPGTTTWYKYGYANNSKPTDETNSSIDIGWAVDKDGNAVSLPGIDFVKVQTGTLQYFGTYYGPSFTCLNCAYDLHLKGVDISNAVE